MLDGDLQRGEPIICSLPTTTGGGGKRQVSRAWGGETFHEILSTRGRLSVQLQRRFVEGCRPTCLDEDLVLAFRLLNLHRHCSVQKLRRES